MIKAVFLDRDGTINIDKGYVHRIEDFELLPRVPEAIALFHEMGFKVIVITNQSGIARGFFSEKELIALNNHLNTILCEHGTYIDAIYYCPHHPDDNCGCRKPKYGLYLRAIADFSVDISASWAVGDSERDILPATELGMNTIQIGEKIASLYEAAKYIKKKGI